MTTKQSARLHLESVNRDCFVVLHTLHHLSALLAMTRPEPFQQSSFRRDGCIRGELHYLGDRACQQPQTITK